MLALVVEYNIIDDIMCWQFQWIHNASVLCVFLSDRAYNDYNYTRSKQLNCADDYD